MAKIDIALLNAQDGQSYPAEVVTDKPVGWWIEQILQALGLPREEQGKRIGYQFLVERTGQVVGEQETLESAGIQAGDALRLERATSAPALSRPAARNRRISRGYVVLGIFLLCSFVLLVAGSYFLVNIFSPSEVLPTSEATSTASISEARSVSAENAADLMEITTVPDVISADWLRFQEK